MYSSSSSCSQFSSPAKPVRKGTGPFLAPCPAELGFCVCVCLDVWSVFVEGTVILDIFYQHVLASVLKEEGCVLVFL